MKTNLLIFFLFVALYSVAQINVDQIDIYRDTYGVPHIYGDTDKDAAYGLAWAHAEDDFETIQNTFLPAKGLMGMHSGKEGVIMDYLIELLRCRKTAENRFYDLSPAVLAVIEGYVAGINAFAKEYPEEVLVKNSFPITVMDYLTGYNLIIHFFSDTGDILGKLIGNKVRTVDEVEMEKKTIGSNAFAFSRTIMEHNKTVLNVNTHQPLEGPFSWYEAHLNSKEGWNILGGLFPGAPFPMIGTNENLGWTHTYNYPDLIDVYELRVNPKNIHEYWLDGGWVLFEESSVKLKVKTKMGFSIKVKKKLIWSAFGPVIKNKKGYFAFFSNAFENISSVDEWYHMGKARNWPEFETALKMMSVPRFNIVYADREDHIFWMNNGRIQKRPLGGKRFNGLMRGESSELINTGYHVYEDLPKLLDPKHGYLFNTNNTPFNSAHELDNLKEEDFRQLQLGFKESENNRSARFVDLMKNKETLSMNDFYRIKYDIQYPDSIWTPSGANIVFGANRAVYPNYKGLISLIQDWDKRGDTTSVGAAQWAIYYYNFLALGSKGLVETERMEQALKATKKHLKKYFGRLDIQFKDYQVHQRGAKKLAVPGLTDMIAAMTSTPFVKGTAKPVHGESYIMILQYSEDGVEIETVLPYGNSRRVSGPHFTDQMEMYARQERKKMTLDKNTITTNALRHYHPK
ncbi:MAG: penicillin acylase family protein [Crocinitomicaceae bacterium]